jgi:SAM-dependent methyltransferase
VTSTYLYDQTWHQERDRIGSLEDLFDASTKHHLDNLGLCPGWTCLEVGCGAGSIASWLADRVGPGGRVVATDIDTRFVDGRGRDNLEVRRHDLLSDPLEPNAFDLAHVRALLEHLGEERERALRSLVGAVKPGGWVVVEDIDAGDIRTSVITRYVDPPDAADVFEQVVRAIATFVLKAGSDPTFGRRLPRALKEAGLVNIGAELHAPLTTAVGPGASLA